MEKQIQVLAQKNKKLLLQGGLVMIVLIVVNWFVLSIVGRQKNQLIESKRTIARLKEENTSIAQTLAFLSSNTEVFTQLSRSVPDEERFLHFVTSVESIAKEYAANPSLRFGSTVPLKDKNNLYIPFSLSLTISQQQITPFLRRFERLPYITQIITVDIEKDRTASDSSEMQVSARIYVENPFSH